MEARQLAADGVRVRRGAETAGNGASGDPGVPPAGRASGGLEALKQRALVRAHGTGIGRWASGLTAELMREPLTEPRLPAPAATS